MLAKELAHGMMNARENHEFKILACLDERICHLIGA